MFDLSGKKAIITGGNRGLGKAMCASLLSAGAETVILASSDSVYEAAETFRKEGYAAHGIKCDLRSKPSIEKAFGEALEILGTVDILVNNAGIQRRNKCEDFTHEDWNEVINVNLNSVFVLCQLAGRVMLEKGRGKIINIASLLSFFGGYTVPAYAASKGGVAQLTKALSNEWASKGINVNAIAPGYMDTDMNVNLINDEKRNTEILARIPAGRWGKPEDMQGAVVFLASAASDYVNGVVIPVDGGYLGR